MRALSREMERNDPAGSEKARSGPLPEGWVTVPLGNVLREALRNGHSAKASSDGRGIRTLTLTAVTVGDFSECNTKVTVADPAKVRDLWLESGDLLVERANTPELVGTARLYRGPSGYAIFPDLLIRVRLSEGVSPSFVELALSTDSARSHFRRSAQGIAGSMPKIDQQTIEEFPLVLAPEPEQRRIVDEVEKQFTRLDAAVAGLQRAKANLKRYRASVLKAACEGRLVPTEAELAQREGRSFESGEELLKRILKERRARWEADQLAKMKAAGRGRTHDAWKTSYEEPASAAEIVVAGVPGWSVASLDQICPVFVDCAHRTPRYSEEGTPALRPRDVVGGFLRLEEAARVATNEYEKQTLRRRPVPGDIIYSRELSFGWAVLVPEAPSVCMSQGMVLFRPSDRVDNRFVRVVLNGPLGRKQAERAATGSAHPHINLADIRTYAVPLPPLPEQHRIVAEVERRLSVVDELEATVEKNLARCARLRQSILKMAFEGRLVPQDPNDEPASVLLDRIRERRRPEEPRRRGVRRVPRP